jgi:hypothetical protein
MSWSLPYKIWIKSLDGKFNDWKEWSSKIICSDKDLVIGISKDRV